MGWQASRLCSSSSITTRLGRGVRDCIEDLFVKPELRGKGIGKALLLHLAKIAVENNCGRYQWQVLDWNETAIEFYESLGAEMMKEWLTMRVDGEALKSCENGEGMSRHIKIIGAGLAGSEAAWQCARRGLDVELYEMRPVRQTPAHQTRISPSWCARIR